MLCSQCISPTSRLCEGHGQWWVCVWVVDSCRVVVIYSGSALMVQHCRNLLLIFSFETAPRPSGSRVVASDARPSRKKLNFSLSCILLEVRTARRFRPALVTSASPSSAGAALKPPNGLITLDYAFTHSASSLTFSGCTDRRSTLLAAHSHTVPFATLSPRRGLPLPIPAPMLVTFPSLVSCARTPLSLHPRSAPMFRSSCLWRLWRPEVGSACWFRRALSVPLVPQTFPLAQANPRLAHLLLAAG